jgi:O-Antigen ligase
MTSTRSLPSWKAFINFLQGAAWALFLICLPVTSFPYLPKAFGGVALVRPLSIYPLILLLFIATIPRLFTGPIPRTIFTLLPFIVIAVASSLLSTLRGIEPVLGVTVSERFVRALLTLGIGCAFYLTVVLLPRTSKDLRASLRWLYAGFFLALIWGSFQAAYVIHFKPSYFQFLNRIQAYISTRKIFENRISGMTYEPNWFAEQISCLLLPWLLAAVLSGTSIFNWRWRKVTVEWILLIWSVILLVLTFSRAGLANLILLLLLSLLFFRTQRHQKAVAKRSSLATWTRRILETGLAVLILGGLIYTASAKNTFFARLWNYWRDVNIRSVSGYLDYIGFGARLMYAEAAFNTYAAYPVMGVGLGNYAFYFEEMLPDQSLATTPEILRILTPEVGRNRLVTPKNLYYRILAETGLLGMAAFAAFFVAVLGCALYLWFSSDLQLRYWGMAGLFGLLAFLASGFSFDSFALPNMWVVFGLITSAAWIFARQEYQSNIPGPSVSITFKGDL